MAVTYALRKFPRNVFVFLFHQSLTWAGYSQMMPDPKAAAAPKVAFSAPLEQAVATDVTLTRNAGVTGDFTWIALAHFILNQVGGSIAGEEASGLGRLIPNAILFQKTLTNYTLEQEYILNEVPVRFELRLSLG